MEKNNKIKQLFDSFRLLLGKQGRRIFFVLFCFTRILSIGQEIESSQFSRIDSIIGEFSNYSKGVCRTYKINEDKTFIEETILITQKPGVKFEGKWCFSKDTLVLIAEIHISSDSIATRTDCTWCFADKYFYKNDQL